MLNCLHHIFSKAISVSFAHVIGMGILTFSAILWPFCDLCDLSMTFSALFWPFCEWQKGSQFYEWQMILSRSNCDLFVTFLWPFQHFCDLFVTFVTFLWPFQHFCDLIVNDKKGHNFMNDKWYYLDLIVTFLWPFYDLFSTFVTFLWMTKRVTILWMTNDTI